MQKKICDQVIWLTGGTKGIGRELALLLAQLGNTVYISARDQVAMDQLVSMYPKNIFG